MPHDADTFVNDPTPLDPGPEPPPSSSGPGVPQSRQRALIKQRDGRTIVRSTLRLEADLARELEVAAFDHRLDQAQIITAALRAYLPTLPKPPRRR